MEKHLDFIQNTIDRLGRNSFLIKGWSITFISLLFILAVNDSSEILLLLSLFPLVCFWVLDAYYLRQERLFRGLYNLTRLGKIEEPFSMDTTAVRNVKSWFFTLFSPTIALVYITIILLNIVLQMLIINKVM